MDKTNKRVLLVDDDLLARRSGARWIRRCLAVEVVEAAGGEEADALLMNEHFDVLVTDLEMPTVDGFELITRTARLKNRPVIGVWSGSDRLQEAAKRAHFAIPKTAPIADLVAALELALAGESGALRNPSGILSRVVRDEDEGSDRPNTSAS